MDPNDPEFKTRADAWLADWAAERRRTGRLPTLDHYRRVYDNLATRHGVEPPSDDEIRRTHPVAP